MKRFIRYFKKQKTNIVERQQETDFKHIHHVSANYLNHFFKNYKPVFILNTGRSGSAFIKTIFDQFDSIEAHHEAFPNLFLLSNFAYSNQQNIEALEKIFEAARMELILKSAIENKIYIESNQCLVFYVNQIKHLFPQARFIHLTRHPGDFVRSAIMKGWHKNDSVWELGRIKSSNKQKWDSFSQTEKLSWVWHSTHNYIEQFKLIHNDSFLTLRLEDLIADTVNFKELLTFIGVDNHLTNKQIEDVLSHRVNKLTISKDEPNNMFKTSDYPKYNKWNAEEKDKLKNIVQESSDKYNYEL
jgi:hypothetical protein